MGYTNITIQMTSFIELLATKDEQIKVPGLLPGSIYNVVFDSYLYVGNRIINNYNNPGNNKIKLCYIGVCNPLTTTHVDTINQKEIDYIFYSRVLPC